MNSPAQTVFYFADTGKAMLVQMPTRKKKRRSGAFGAMPFRDPQAALAWCIQHGAGFVFTPASPASNN